MRYLCIRYGLFFCLIVLCMALLMPSAQAEERKAIAFDYSAFEKIPVLHEGRIKPLLAFARGYMVRFSGSDRLQIDDMDAIEWLAELLFDPTKAQNRPVFRVRDPRLREVLALSPRPNHAYNYIELERSLQSQAEFLAASLAMSPEQITDVQKGLIDLHENMIVFSQLMNSFSLLQPIYFDRPAIELLPTGLQEWAQQGGNYFESLRFAEFFERETGRIARQIMQQETPYLSGLSDRDNAVMNLHFHLNRIAEHGRLNILFRVVPSPYGQQATEQGGIGWFSPWALYQQGAAGPDTVPIIQGWQGALYAYKNNDPVKWQSSSAEILKKSLAFTPRSALLRSSSLNIEVWYHKIKPMELSFLFCLFSVFFLLGWRVTNHRYSDFIRLAWISLSGSAIIHSAAIFARMWILSRPPISTLYESIIFVAGVSILFGLFWAYQYRRTEKQAVFGLFAGAAAGVLLNLVAFSHTGQGETMIVLAAVLNSGFWLATHVIIISIGYALCLLAALLAHINLYQWKNKTARAMTEPMVLHTVRLALLFVITGTILGGIWADQSWGRFWGWDPKENGALLIVLWIVWLLHIRMTNMVAAHWVMAGMAFLTVIVALSWFGTNLLGIGLHSYGFSDRTLWALVGTTIIEIFLIGLLLLRLSMTGKQKNKAVRST